MVGMVKFKEIYNIVSLFKSNYFYWYYIICVVVGDNISEIKF